VSPRVLAARFVLLIDQFVQEINGRYRSIRKELIDEVTTWRLDFDGWLLLQLLHEFEELPDLNEQWLECVQQSLAVPRTRLVTELQLIKPRTYSPHDPSTKTTARYIKTPPNQRWLIEELNSCKRTYFLWNLRGCGLMIQSFTLLFFSKGFTVWQWADRIRLENSTPFSSW
jgi:hypothetical protein